MISSDLKAVSVGTGLPGPPWGHGDPVQTLGNNVIVGHNKPLATDHQKATRDTQQLSRNGILREQSRGANSLKDEY